MTNMRDNPELYSVLKDPEFSKKIKLFFTKSETVGDDYDPYEGKKTRTNLNPITIKGYVAQFTPTSLVWNDYGLTEQGSVQVLCDKKYKSLFEMANKVEIEGKDYSVFKDGQGGRSLITVKPYNLITVILKRVA